jgi:hypothetical protein
MWCEPPRLSKVIAQYVPLPDVEYQMFNVDPRVLLPAPPLSYKYQLFTNVPPQELTGPPYPGGGPAADALDALAKTLATTNPATTAKPTNLVLTFCNRFISRTIAAGVSQVIPQAGEAISSRFG